MTQIQVTARFTIHPGGYERFVAIADEMIAIVGAQDTGTLQYDWFFSASGDECVVRETYVDSEAVLEHIAHVGDRLGAMLEVADLELEVYGDPSPELAEAAAALAPSVYSFHGGLARD